MSPRTAAKTSETDLELARLFELLHVALALERAACGQEHVLVIAVDVLSPGREPSHSVVVYDLLPFPWHIRLWCGYALTNIDRDVLGSHSVLHRPAYINMCHFDIPQYTTFREPFFGWSPRPLKRPGGSTRKLPTFSLRPSSTQWVNGASSVSFAALASFFSAVVIAFFFAFSASKCSYIGLKSHRLNSVIFVLSR